MTQKLGPLSNREVGLFISNAGSDPNGGRFLERDCDGGRQWQQPFACRCRINYIL